MNNNGFSLLRYFRDLGHDAYLLLFEDDEAGSSSHFSIINDSWEYDKWKSYIINLPAVNSYAQALSNDLLCRIILKFAYLIKFILGFKNIIYTRPAKKRDIHNFRKILTDYDYIIGSGATPAIMQSMNLRLNLFFAYSIGIEYVDEEYFSIYKNSKNPITSYIAKKMRKLQIKGIKNSQICLNTEMSSTYKAFSKINVITHPVHLPIVYTFEKYSKNLFSKNLNFIIKKIRSTENPFVVVSHARHQWIMPQKFESKKWKVLSKNNDWLIHGFKRFIKKRPNSNAFLILFEYGEDYLETKKLCIAEGIFDKVQWMPIMPRKEILYIIKNSSVGIGEFYHDDVMWGGTGWEILSQGKPLIQGYRKNSNQFKKEYGFEPPPIFAANSINSIYENLLELYDDSTLRKKSGQLSLDWYLKNNAHVAAKKIVDLLEQKSKVE